MPPASEVTALKCVELWNRHADRLVLYATAVLVDRALAEDALQNVFTRLWQRGGGDGPEFDLAYLFRAVRNEALNMRRADERGRKRRAFLEPATEDPGRRAELAEWRSRVEEGLLSLEAGEREAVVLRIWGDLSGSEAASVAGVTEKAMEHRYYRGLAALKSFLGEVDA